MSTIKRDKTPKGEGLSPTFKSELLQNYDSSLMMQQNVRVLVSVIG
jgi:hypothetical protein